MFFLGVPVEFGVLGDVDVPEKVDGVPWNEGPGQKDGASELKDVEDPVRKMELEDVVVVLVVDDGRGSTPWEDVRGVSITFGDDDRHYHKPYFA